ncbi:MAG: DNA mismatch repair protein MutS [Clostridiales bacterium]|nr:DNA mismatch repair protein MutS [Clostridiales bacterium]
MAQFTPMIEQYLKVKEQYPDAILFFRLGDFYEMFFDDAKTASRELELVLTGRDCGREEKAPMCGIPYHAADSYIAKLVAKGYKVAICEQMEDPAAAKGIVKRDVIRVHTPGTVIESAMLDEGKNNYLGCIYSEEQNIGLCFADISTGSICATEFSGSSARERAISEIARFAPAEILVNGYTAKLSEVNEFLTRKITLFAETLDDSKFDADTCEKIVTGLYKKPLSELNLQDRTYALRALGATIFYLEQVQKNDLGNINEPEIYNDERFMTLNASARLNLELCETQRRREKKGSLLWVLDYTKTPMGKRLIRSWIEQPLISVSHIISRQNAVAELYSDTEFREGEMECLAGVGDIERILTRVVYGSANAKELRALSQTLAKIPALKQKLNNRQSKMFQSVNSDLDPLADICELIDSAICEDPPFTVREGNMIKAGFNSELDSLRDITSGGKDSLSKIEEEEQKKTGIKKLKIGYNRVFGYYIEVINSYKELVPDNYIRKQTLSNCERYITPELKELESKVLGAQERIVSLEYEIFVQIRKKVADARYRLKRTAEAIGRLDVLCSFAKAAVENNYERPDVDNSDVIEIKDGRHPVVEKYTDGLPFVPNDTFLDCGENRTAIITGPNMAGKSTYMRQIALIVLMAQIGSFVPAKSARIGIVDSIFTRVGAADDLAAGQSTFMLEMSEVASIIKNATSKSLIILDEIGRGTSTYDGMSIARAVLEYTADKKKLGAKTLFATHYHELTELEGEISGVKNYNTSVKKRGDDITFLRRIVRGPADGSYGIDVAKLAGVPASIVARARAILNDLEKDDGQTKALSSQKNNRPKEETQISFEGGVNYEIAEELKKIDIETLTPIEALTKLYELKNKLIQ